MCKLIFRNSKFGEYEEELNEINNLPAKRIQNLQENLKIILITLNIGSGFFSSMFFCFAMKFHLFQFSTLNLQTNKI